MALPKSRHSKARSRKRRANWKLAAPNLQICPNCEGYKTRHVACPECGYYMGRAVMEVKES
jgi:large subunit ribosomal protein L32